MDLSFYNIGRFCSGIVLQEPQSEIDLATITFFSPFALVYLGMYLRHHTSLGYGFVVKLPENNAARDYLARQRFWERFNFSEDSVRQESLRRITTSTSLNDIVDIEKSDYIGEDIGDMVRDVLISNGCYSPSPVQMGGIVAELVDNFAQHSYRHLAALALQFYPRLGTLRLAIGDCGVGIRESLLENPKHGWLEDQPHHVAAKEALKAGISRKPEGGVGFVDVLNGIDELGGQLLLATGNEYISVRKGRIAHGGMRYDLTGVQIELVLPAGTKIG